MTIWIDQPIWPRHGTVFAHLVSDTSLDELHAFAARVGLHPRSFEGDHYDVPQERHAAVLAAGATSTTGAGVVRRLIASGLRLRKRRGDRPVARVQGVRFPDGSIVDVDLIASEREVDVGIVVAALVFVQDRDGRFAVVYTPRRRPGDRRAAPSSRARRRPRLPCARSARRPGWAEGGRHQPCAYERFEVVGEFPGSCRPAAATCSCTGPPSRAVRRRCGRARTTSTGGAGWTGTSSSASAVPSSGGRWSRVCSTAVPDGA